MDLSGLLDCDVAIFGGGAAGLWLLDGLRCRGVRALLLDLRSDRPSQASLAQGILHGGTRYALSGLLSGAARALNDMPNLWRSHLRGETEPDLSAVRIRSDHCHLWRSERLRSRVGLMAAQATLSVRPVPIPQSERPGILHRCPGDVFRLDEQVIDPVSLLNVLRRRNGPFVLPFDALEVEGGQRLTVIDRTGNRRLNIHASTIVLTAGAGNDGLRRQFDLSGETMQLRPLHAVLLRGDLPPLFGHCIDGASTRVTITSDQDSQGRTVWQLGGQISEVGVEMSSEELIQFARKELDEILPGWMLPPVEWATVRINRAEGRNAQGLRPDSVQVLREGNVITAWPTKLVLVPRLAERILEELNPEPSTGHCEFEASIRDRHWPPPDDVRPIWEGGLEWSAGS